MDNQARPGSPRYPSGLGYEMAAISSRPSSPGLAPPTPRAGSPLLGNQSQDILVQPSSPGPRTTVGTIPDTVPPYSVRVITDNPWDAENTPAHFVAKKIDPENEKDKKYDDLTFWPTVLQLWPSLGLVAVYVIVAMSIGVLYQRSGTEHQFQVGSENVHMIARYFPSIIGTVTVLWFRQTVREAIRMTPYVNMADQKDGDCLGAGARQSVSGAFFPWQNITVTPGVLSFFSLMCQFWGSFIVSLKVALLATNPSTKQEGPPHWTLTVRFYPALFLIVGYVMMAGYTLIVLHHFRGKSTGLKWDPVSIADYVSLFARSNALECFSCLELRHEQSAKAVLSSSKRFRLGYWTVKRNPETNSSVEEVVYGIGESWPGEKTKGPKPRPSYLRWLGHAEHDTEPLPLKDCQGKEGRCAHGRWPDCEHYPYRQNPGIERWILVLAILVIWTSLGGAIFALAKGWPMKSPGFTLRNDWSIPSNFSFDSDNSTLFKFPPLDPVDPKSNLLVYALLFRSAPTYVAGLFTSYIIVSLDLNMRFMQPFRDMLEPSEVQRFPNGKFMTTDTSFASKTVLLRYITLSSLQVPLTAYDNEHYKVSWFSTLSTISPLFPIFVGGLLTVSTTDEKTVDFSFSLSAYIGILVSLALYSFSLPWAFPHPHRLLPRQFYSLADLMAMCHQARWLSSPHLDIADPNRTPSKEHMEARILLSGDEFSFGEYTGRDGEQHLGFDVAATRNHDFEPIQRTRMVNWIEPEGWAMFARRKVEEVRVRATTFFNLEAGLATGHDRVGRENEFQRRRPGDDPAEMSGGLQDVAHATHTTGRAQLDAEDAGLASRLPAVVPPSTPP